MTCEWKDLPARIPVELALALYCRHIGLSVELAQEAARQLVGALPAGNCAGTIWLCDHSVQVEPSEAGPLVQAAEVTQVLRRVAAGVCHPSQG